MKDDEDFAQLISEYQLTYGNELQAKLGRLDGIIGDRHWLSVGTYKENLVKNLLRNKLPKKYEIGTGFVLTYRDKQRVISKQIDVLVWDSAEHSPFFRDGEFVVVPPEACLAAIEVKSTLTSKELKKALSNLDSLMQFYPDHLDLRQKVLHRSIFAFELGKDVSFPEGIWNALYSSCSRSTILPLKDRADFSSMSSDWWQFPWISTVSVLGAGNVHCDFWSLDSVPHAVYTVNETRNDEGTLDAYGFLERSLLMDLTLGYNYYFSRQSRPGLTSFLYANNKVQSNGKSFMPIPPIKNLKQVGKYEGIENTEWINKAYSPRKIRTASSNAENKDCKK